MTMVDIPLLFFSTNIAQPTDDPLEQELYRDHRCNLSVGKRHTEASVYGCELFFVSFIFTAKWKVTILSGGISGLLVLSCKFPLYCRIESYYFELRDFRLADRSFARISRIKTRAKAALRYLQLRMV